MILLGLDISINSSGYDKHPSSITTSSFDSFIILGLKQVIDKDLIDKICKKAIEANQKPVEQYKNGHKKAIGALVGFCMKEGKGQVNPKHIS